MTAMATDRVGLTLGPLDLAEVLGRPFAPGTYAMCAAPATAFGSGEPITAVVASLLADGDHVTYDRDGNRQVTILVRVEAGDHLGLALAEAALDDQMRRRNTLTWTPPDRDAPTTVFEVVTSWFEVPLDDVGEIYTRRTFAVTLTCLPHARSADVRTVTATPAPHALAKPCVCRSGRTFEDCCAIA